MLEIHDILVPVRYDPDAVPDPYDPDAIPDPRIRTYI